MTIPPYRNRAVQDLAWACFTPPLLHTPTLVKDDLEVSNCALSLTTARRHWLTQLDNDPQLLLAHLARRPSHRVGIYFEQLWQFFLAQDPATELIDHNLPVRQDGKTLGEFDCLYYCHERGRHIHLELAVKFYLGQPGTHKPPGPSPWQQWLGPGGSDRLDLKIDRLMGHQVRLASHAAAQTLLAERRIEAVDREVEIKGYLFQDWRGAVPAPVAYNNQLAISHWLYAEQLPLVEARFAQCHFVVLPRVQWLSPLHEPETTMDLEALQSLITSHFECSNRARLIAAIDADGLEQGRFFVVSRAWPEAHAPDVSQS